MKRLEEIEERKRVAEKFESYANLAEIVREDVPYLLEQLKGAIEVIEYYAEGAKVGDLEVMPDKKELWSIPDKWAQRSMSDHWSGKRARDFLKEMRSDE